MNDTAPTTCLVPPNLWRIDNRTCIWWLRLGDTGNYSVKFSGYDFIINRDGIHTIGRRLNLQTAREAAENDANERIRAAVTTRPQPDTGSAITRAAINAALRTTLDLAEIILPDPTKGQRDIAQIMVDSVADLLGIARPEYDPYLNRET